MALDIAQMVYQVLGVSNPASACSQCSAMQFQLLYIILIPHVIILLFLYGFSTVVSMSHKGFRNLLAIVGYIFIVLSGWYGMLVPILIAWWYALIGVYLFVFILTRFGFHPGRAKEYIGMFKSIGAKVGEKGKKEEALEKQIRKVDKQLAAVRRQMVGITPGTPEFGTLRLMIAQLEAQKADLEQELAELE